MAMIRILYVSKLKFWLRNDPVSNSFLSRSKTIDTVYLEHGSITVIRGALTFSFFTLPFRRVKDQFRQVIRIPPEHSLKTFQLSSDGTCHPTLQQIRYHSSATGRVSTKTYGNEEHELRKDFYQGEIISGFFQEWPDRSFQGGGQSGEISFFLLKTKTITFFAKNAIEKHQISKSPCRTLRRR